MRRLDQLLSNLGYCSRSEARDWVRAGRVTVGGKVAKDFGQKAAPATVLVDGEPLDHPDGLLLLVHKPVGLVYVGLASAAGVTSTSFSWAGTRREVQSRTAKLALNAVRLHLVR